MRAYYLSKIKQVLDDGLGQMVWKHRLQEFDNVDYLGGEIKVDPETGIPTEKALLVLVGSKHHKDLRNDPDLIPLPVGRDSLSVKLSAIETPTKLQFRRKVKDLGIDDAEVNAMTDDTKSWRDVTNELGRKNNPNFDVDAFDFDEA